MRTNMNTQANGDVGIDSPFILGPGLQYLVQEVKLPNSPLIDRAKHAASGKSKWLIPLVQLQKRRYHVRD